MQDTIALPSVPAHVNEALAEATKQLNAKAARNRIRADYYEARHLAVKTTDVVPDKYRKLGLVLGWTGKAVDLLARRCHLDGLAWPGGDLDGAGWAELAEGNAFHAEISQAITEALLYGVAFLATTKATAAEIAAGGPPVLTHTVSALNGTGRWNPRTRRLDTMLVVNQRGKDNAAAPERITDLTLYLPGQAVQATWDGGAWDVDITDSALQVPVEPLIYKPRTGRPFGSSRITRAMMAHQDQGLRELVRLEGHLDHFAWPQYWLLGADQSAFSQEFRAHMATVMAIPDDHDGAETSLARADIKQFPASSPAPHLAALNAAAQLFAREASLPDSALSITDYANPTSAEAYDSSQYELIHEAEGATLGFTAPVARAAARMLAMANPGQAFPGLIPTWRNPRHLTRSAAADAGMKQLTAAPELAGTELGYELLGLTPDQTRRALAERDAGQQRQRVRDILANTDNADRLEPEAEPEAQPDAAPDALLG